MNKLRIPQSISQMAVYVNRLDFKMTEPDSRGYSPLVTHDSGGTDGISIVEYPH